MTTRCPAPADLLLYALQLADERKPRDVAHHVSRCASCQATVKEIREAISVLHSPGVESPATGRCLDEMAIANFVEQGMDAAERPEIIAHLAVCARCREQIASVAGLLRSASIAAEVQRSEVPSITHGIRRWRIAGAGTLAALAAAVTFMFGRPSDRNAVTKPVPGATSVDAHREQSVTTTVAPNLLAPVGVVSTADTFSWTSVPHADRYRLTLFDREGTDVWQAETSDTAIATPKSVIAESGTAYLWKVEARTGWNRWVASDLVEFSVAPAGRIP